MHIMEILYINLLQILVTESRDMVHW